jgi:uncharacterized protein
MRMYNALCGLLVLVIFVPLAIASDEARLTLPDPDVSAQKSPAIKAGSVTPLLAAVGSGDEARVRALLQAGAQPDDPTSPRSPLVQAVTSFRGSGTLYCNIPIVRLLLSHGADPNRRDQQIGALPLLTAFGVGDLECARTIRDAGGRPDMREDGGRTILLSAVIGASNTANVGLLDAAIKWGIDVNDRATDGSTALHEAVRIQSADIATALLERGADPCLKNNIGQTPLAMALNLHRPPQLVDLLRRVTRCEQGER